MALNHNISLYLHDTTKNGANYCYVEKHEFTKFLMITFRCEDHGECRYYYWYPIDYSPAPLYCYLYRSCLGGAEEDRVGIVVGGRHPGHYFLGKNTIR